MNPRLPHLPSIWPRAVAVVILAVQCLPLAAASGTNTNATTSARSTAGATPPARIDYSTFKLVTDRNIFNAGRSGRAPMSSTTEVRRPARVDSFGLVGTMDYEKGTVAFFDGNSSEFRKALQVNSTNATIAGFKLAAATFQSVKLITETNTFELKVGMSLRREEEGPWVATTGTDFASSSGGGSSSSHDRDFGRGGDRGSRDRGSSSSVSSPSASVSSADAAEVLRKLMERRAKEDQ
jgi:hypothetical protein